jgi:hypothetical protein
VAAVSSNPSSMAGAALCRQTPEVGAECPNRARSDLCGGCPVTGIPTAILGHKPSSEDSAEISASGHPQLICADKKLPTVSTKPAMASPWVAISKCRLPQPR